ncbi:cytochrome D1 domain-containing protein [Sulfurisoma sediminicola]|uniref:Protein NirF n=1 Tax=Sulfurisoma sediminicola TaxID=1381557 RepID=A0A497X9K4_9PROT|nr:cytochrome D1 domain-containing protein [Sulfurisoma sediminicola]RLJ62758.1 protein NirF [Sulfurisoma sediminicola]
MMTMNRWLTFLAALLLAGCAQTGLRGTGDLGVVVERASGRIAIVDTTAKSIIASVHGLGDLSHASVVFSRDGRYAYVFGRDGGLSKVDLLLARIDKRVMQAGNSIGGAISQDGRLVVAQNYEPGGIKVFDADTLELLSEVPAQSKVVGLADLSGNRFAYALFDKGEIWISDLANPRDPKTQKYPAGQQPYDGLVTPDGRHYMAGLFGEDGIALLDTWRPELGSRKILEHYGKGQEKLPVFKMPHLRGWAVAGGKAYLPAIGRHEVLLVDTATWKEAGRIEVKGQPVFVMARPDGRQVWVNFAFPDNGWVQVIDTLKGEVVQTLQPGKAILHMEFTPRGEQVWLSARDDNLVSIYDTQSFARLTTLQAESPSGIFFTSRAARTGF